jgi:hypothetical protein
LFQSLPFFVYILQGIKPLACSGSCCLAPRHNSLVSSMLVRHQCAFCAKWLASDQLEARVLPSGGKQLPGSGEARATAPCRARVARHARTGVGHYGVSLEPCPPEWGACSDGGSLTCVRTMDAAS